MQKSTPRRRTVLSVLGTGLATSLLGTGAATQSESEYLLGQNDGCVPVQPLRGDSPADAFYEYQLPERYVSEENGAVVGESATYASAGTIDLQRAQTSISFLYQGPEGLSLVVVHGSVENDDAGSVTFEVSGLPEEGEWIVKDDLYRNPDTGDLASTNYDRWNVAGTDHRIDWTWGSAGTDGGVFRDLGDDFELTIHPAFNEDATLYDEYYDGTVTDWEFLSAADPDPERISLDLAQPIRIATGSCQDHDAPRNIDRETDRQEKPKGGTTETERQKDTEQTVEQEQDVDVEQEQDAEVEQEQDVDVEQEQVVDVEQDQEIHADGEVETEQKQEVTTEQEQKTATEKKEEAEGT